MAARVFSVEFRSVIAQLILNGESVLAISREFMIQAQHTLPLARRLSSFGRLVDGAGTFTGMS
jgi:transposase-like protein